MNQLLIVPDLPDDVGAVLTGAEDLLLQMLDELIDDPTEDWRYPSPLGDRAALQALYRIWDSVRTGLSPDDNQHRPANPTPYTGPRWYAPDGRYELVALSWVPIDPADATIVQAAVDAVAPHAANDLVAETIDDLQREALRGAAEVTDALQAIGRLLAVHADADSELLRELAASAAGQGKLILTEHQTAAYHRLADRLALALWKGDPRGGIVRRQLLFGTRDQKI